VDLSWIHWSSWWLGIVSAYAGTCLLIGLSLGIGKAVCAIRVARERRRRVDALTTPGVAPEQVAAALHARQQQRDQDAVEALLRSLSQKPGGSSWVW
jgi:hypothetical protein